MNRHMGRQTDTHTQVSVSTCAFTYIADKRRKSVRGKARRQWESCGFGGGGAVLEASTLPELSRRSSAEGLTAASRAASHSDKAKLHLSERALKSMNKIKL